MADIPDLKIRVATDGIAPAAFDRRSGNAASETVVPG
jgi:hypothetical protein